MDIKVGEYVRTPYNKIEKVIKITKENGWTCVTTNKDAYELQWLKNNKVKHSKNIIDLIEVGDIVEYQVNSLSELKVGRVKSYRDARSNKEYLGVEGFDITKIYIETILTKEQMEANYYKVKGE